MRIEVATSYYPRLSKWHVRRALKWISPIDLAGVQSVCLLDEKPREPGAQQQPSYLLGFTENGKYVKEGRGAPHIDLYLRDLYLFIPSLMKFTPAATLNIALTLAHEVGHHVVETRGYVYVPTEKYRPYGTHDADKERVCDSYAYDVIRKMSRSWYYKFGDFLRKRISDYFFIRGEMEWDKKNYHGAAYNWFCACMADSNYDDAGRSYHKAIKMLSSPN